MWDWLQDQHWLVWLGAVSIGSLVLAAVLLPILVARLPADYFVRRHRIGLHGRRGWVDWAWHLGKNTLGAVLVVAGIAMIVLPGQGLLTILIGVLLLDFPGKRRLERALITRPGILRVVNRIRERRGVPPLQTEPRTPQG